MPDDDSRSLLAALAALEVLRGRKGIGGELDQIDEETMDEIIEEMESAIAAFYEDLFVEESE